MTVNVTFCAATTIVSAATAAITAATTASRRYKLLHLQDVLNCKSTTLVQLLRLRCRTNVLQLLLLQVQYLLLYRLLCFYCESYCW